MQTAPDYSSATTKILVTFWSERDCYITSDCRNSFNNKLKLINKEKIYLIQQIQSLELKNLFRKNVIRL